MRRSKWPVQYRIRYKLPQHISWAYKYTMSTTDQQAFDSFMATFEHLRIKFGKPDDPLPTIKRMEKFVTHAGKWVTVHFPR